MKKELPEWGETEAFPQWFERMEGRKLTGDEAEFLQNFGAYIRKHYGRELSDQEKHLSLVQAYQIGDL